MIVPDKKIMGMIVSNGIGNMKLKEGATDEQKALFKKFLEESEIKITEEK